MAQIVFFFGRAKKKKNRGIGKGRRAGHCTTLGAEFTWKRGLHYWTRTTSMVLLFRRSERKEWKGMVGPGRIYKGTFLTRVEMG